MNRVAVLIVALVALLSCAACQGNSHPGSPSATRAVPTVPPGYELPEGMRWLGVGQVVLAVPRSWGRANSECLPGEAPYVYFDGAQCPHVQVPDNGPDAVRLQTDRAHRISSVGLGRADWAARSYYFDESARDREDPRVTGNSGCAPYAAKQANRIKWDCFDTFTLDESDVGVMVRVYVEGPRSTAFDKAELEVLRFRRSIKVLPEGYTTVPYVDYGVSAKTALRVLKTAGLTAQMPDVNFPYYITGTEPAAGEIVATGSRIDLMIGDG